MDERDEILEQALQEAQARWPDASSQRHAAFANSVAYLVTGWSGGYGGPSVREHAACRMYAGQGPLDEGFWPEEEATRLLLDPSGPIFGPFIELHLACWREEHCFDDDPQDIIELEGR